MRKRQRTDLDRLGFLRVIGISLLILGIRIEARAQGPSPSYYFHPQTELAWAKAYLHLEGGSRQKIPFLPVIVSSFRHAPFGTGIYDKDVAVDGPVIFAGNGIVNGRVWDSYSGRRADYTTGAIDAAGGIVVFSWDGTDSVETKCGREFPLARRIADAAARKAAAVVVFSWSKEFPFPSVQYEKADDIPDIPVIVVTKGSILSVLAAAGVDGDAVLKSWAESGTPPQSQVLIARLSIDLRGRFEAVETGNFLFRFLGGSFPGKEIDDLAQVNEKSLTLLGTIFNADRKLAWKKLPVYYFRDYDTKVFYTHHWGLGWATDEGTYMVHPGGAPNFPLVVHENAHILIGANWGGSSSFLSEGIGRFAEAEAGDHDKNDRQTLGYLKEGKLFRLRDMLSFNIGLPGLETNVGYPAAGSFVGFLIRTRGLAAFKEIYLLVAPTEDGGKSDGIWHKGTGKSLAELEREWLLGLARTHPEDAAAIRAYVERTAK
jgi:hypothetical protein